MRVAFMFVEFNDIDVFSVYIGHAYFNAPCHEKIWTKYGPKYGSHQGCVMLIVRAMYRLKSCGDSWSAVLAETLGKDSLGYTSTSAYKDV